jgi:hypothetical protein
MPENIQNRRHLIRTIERKGKIGNKRSLKDNIADNWPNAGADVLKKRIYEAQQKPILTNGLVEETKIY